ncbi:heparan-alpha-glucosaminide N-acetyltransferase [Paraconexibacter sp.]|uniref:heparan-alpha-glucosaminide N-acetyltransferase n=1 Tax=Paraconexibacter sp. TaxID=2949640 RepID=UPI0035669C71
MQDTAADARLWEIDALRTTAMVLMVVYHVGYDVHMLAPQVALDPFEGGWRALQITTGSLFLGVVGVSFWIAHSRAVSRGIAGLGLWRAHAARAVEVLAAAALVSFATLVALGGDDAVRFGILHLIGVLMLVVLPLTVRLGVWNAVLGACVVAVGIAMDARSDVPGALVLGFIPPEKGVDWYPLLPWAGAAFVGIALGSALYPGGQRGPSLRLLVTAPRSRLLAGAPGRYSLPFYLVHQPVLIALTAMTLALVGTEIDPS